MTVTMYGGPGHDRAAEIPDGVTSFALPARHHFGGREMMWHRYEVAGDRATYRQSYRAERVLPEGILVVAELEGVA